MKTQKIRLNRFLAICGVGSRRKCDDYIAAGKVSVNGKVVTEMGVRIDPGKDKIEYQNNIVQQQDDHLYILLNKPLRTVTSLQDEKGRKTVINLVDIDQRIFPVGRLDFDTTGVLLLTSDGKLSYLLSHPKFQVRKIYRVLLNKRIRAVDLHHFRKGLMLDDKITAPCKTDELRIIDNSSYLEVELHEGRNRQIRRMFELLGYQVEKLHRSEFAGLRVNNLKTGEWRVLSKSELRTLKGLAKAHQEEIMGSPDERK
jgi:23S rRNA pseudouridine2605 synthase